MMQAPSSRIPPIRAAAVASDLYKPCACIRAGKMDACKARWGVSPVFALCVQLNCAPVGLVESAMQAVGNGRVTAKAVNLDLEDGNDFR